ncbi:MAG: hypothetical protein JOZ54_18220 [Acidobacteria bacterium]|nr:hypothetical protein [Acidobacteriota bacterium]
MKIAEIYASSFSALRLELPELADVDRPRLIRRMKSPMHRAEYHEHHILPYQHAPFDVRWVHVATLANPYLELAASGADWIAMPTGGKPFVTRHVVLGDARMIPAQVIVREWSDSARRAVVSRVPNLTRDAHNYLLRHGASEEDLFHHVAAWLVAGADANRIPFPDDRAKLRASAHLGHRLTRAFCADDSLMARAQEPELRAIGVPTRIGKEARMLRGSVLLVDDAWRDGERIVIRPYADDELAALQDFAGATGNAVADVLALLGEQTCDVQLNEKAFWKNVPLAVWKRGELRDWLRARHASALERPLSRDEVAHFSNAARRITSLCLLAPSLARNADHLGVHASHLRTMSAPPQAIRTRETPFAS